MDTINAFGQPVGGDVALDLPRPAPAHVTLEGGLIRAVPMALEHAEGLYDRIGGPDRAPLWTYMPVGPFPDFHSFYDWFETVCESRDPLFFTLEDIAGGRPLGFVSLLRMAPEVGVVEIGFVMLSKALQCTAAATEVMRLFMGYVFDELGYRRYEWKCDAMNAPSRRAAERLGFTYEGTFRQATVYKGRNRDTAWYSITDEEWSHVKRGLDVWLAPENFDPMGQQIQRLEACRG